MGYIKVDKKIKEWEWFTDGNMLKMWMYLLTTAQYQDSSFQGIEVKRGQVVTGRKKLAERLAMSEQQVRTCLEKLQSTNEITIKATNKYSVITIIKYADYQDGEEESNQQSSQQQTQQITNKQPTNNHNKRNREYKEYKKNIYTGHSQPFIDAFEQYKEHRKKMKSPLTDYACNLTIKKLETMGDENTQIKIINQSIENGWKGLWGLKEDKKDTLPTYNQNNNKQMSQEEEDELLTLMGKKRYDPSNNPKIPEEKKREILERMGQLKKEKEISYE